MSDIVQTVIKGVAIVGLSVAANTFTATQAEACKFPHPCPYGGEGQGRGPNGRAPNNGGGGNCARDGRENDPDCQAKLRNRTGPAGGEVFIPGKGMVHVNPAPGVKAPERGGCDDRDPLAHLRRECREQPRTK